MLIASSALTSPPALNGNAGPRGHRHAVQFGANDLFPLLDLFSSRDKTPAEKSAEEASDSRFKALIFSLCALSLGAFGMSHYVTTQHEKATAATIQEYVTSDPQVQPYLANKITQQLTAKEKVQFLADNLSATSPQLQKLCDLLLPQVEDVEIQTKLKAMQKLRDQGESAPIIQLIGQDILKNDLKRL